MPDYLFWMLWFVSILVASVCWFNIGKLTQKLSTIRWSMNYLEGMKKNVVDTMVEHVTKEKSVSKEAKARHEREHLIDGAVNIGELRVLQKLVKEL